MTSFRERKARKRAAHIQHLQARNLKPVAPALRRRDPLDKPSLAPALVAALVALFGVGAVAAHAVVILILFGVGSVLHTEKEPGRDVIEVAVIEPKPLEPEPPKVEEPPPPEPEPEPEVKAPEPEPEPEPEPPKPKPKPKIKEPPKVDQPPPPDPINKPQEPPPEPPKEPKRAVIGLDEQSAIEGGDGPSFATGNTRMGETERVAEDPNKIDKLPPGQGGTPGGKAGVPTPNKVAGRIPGSTIQSTKATYDGKKLEPVYPRALQRRGIEGNVKVQVTIGPDGKTAAVKVLQGSGYPEMDEAAISTAQRQAWIAATRDGAPISSTISYSYRFRISDY